MGILSRFADIMSANINALLDKCEDPAKMIDQYMLELTESLADVKKETAGVMAEEKRVERLLNENKAEVAKYTDFAKKAIAAGNEGDARVFISKKQELAEAGEQLALTYEVAHGNAVKMREMHDKLTRDIESLEMRRRSVKAKMAVAKTQDKMNKIGDSMESVSGSMQAFERMESKADRMLDEANSMAELGATPKDEAAGLAEKYAGSSTAVDDELAALKKEMGL